MRLVFWMLCGSAPMSLVGVWLSHRLGKGAADLQTKIIATALIMGGIGFMVKSFLKQGRRGERRAFRPSSRAIASSPWRWARAVVSSSG